MSKRLRMYVASAGDTAMSGVYYIDLDVTTGEMRQVGSTDAVESCLYLAFHPVQPVLYATGSFRGEAQICSFRVEPDETLALINRQPTNGHEPCYVSVAGANQYVLVANYTGAAQVGSIASFPLQSDGAVLPLAAHIQLAGSSVHRPRQNASHPHMIIPSPDDDFVFVPDLGTDKVMIYRLDLDSGQLHPHAPACLGLELGSGPRHLAFHPSRPVFYVMSELQPVLTVVAYDAVGRFEVVDTYPTLPPVGAVAVNQGADIHITPTGRFLYASNRGHNSIVAYEIGPSGTDLTYVEHQSTLGDWPRSFAIDPSGRMLVVANQRTNDLHTFHIDVISGRLTPTGYQASVPAPVCVEVGRSDFRAG